MRRLWFALLLPLAVGAQRPRTAPTLPPAALDSSAWASLRYRHIGPEGNRVSAVAGVSGDPLTYYAGAASGGIWKSTDGGVHWTPIFDKEQGQSIGAIAVAPSDPNVVWVGTGEHWIRSHISVGFGVYRSTDAGKSWARVGLETSGRISRIVVHPTNPDLAYVAVQGHGYQPQAERGIWRTADAGRTWEKVLFVSDSAGASDLVMDPTNPRILFAGFWQLDIKTWGRLSGGPHSGIWKSSDGGTTWKRLVGNGLPTAWVGKIGLGMSQANPQRVYALIETGDGVPARNVPNPATGRFWRSDDGGETWRLVSSDRQLAGRTHYYNRFGVTPDNAEEAYFLTANWAKTLDGGTTIMDPPPQQYPGGDHHDIWFDQRNGDRFAVAHDGGISITTTRGRSWLRRQLPIAQMYHVTVDDRIPYWVYGNRQDGPSARGPSNARFSSFFGGGIPRGAWATVGGGESGFATPDPVDSNWVWSSASGYGSVGGIVSRHDLRTGMTENYEVWPKATLGTPAESLKYRFQWNFPLHISPHDHKRVYVGSQHVHVTTDNGRSWKELSPDLTRNDKSRQQLSGGLTPDNIGVEYAGVIMSLAESPIEKGLIWAGTNDGKLQLTRNGGQSWTDLTANVTGLPEWATIAYIHASKHAAGTAYLAVDGHQIGNFDPWLYKTTDYGRTFTRIVAGIPRSTLSYAHVVIEDPVVPGLLFSGFENGLYVSFDAGAQWHPLQNNLPRTPVYGIQVQERFGDLVVGTYGRGFWILDDMTPLRTLAREAAGDVAFFAPREAWRFREVDAPFFDYDDTVNGDNPPYGAALSWWLKAEAKDSAKVEVLAADGSVVRTLKGAAKAGVNRLWWDLRDELTTEARIRTSPSYSPWLNVTADGRPAPGIQRFNALVLPGRYTVRLTAGGRTLERPLEVRKDPNAPGDARALELQQVATRAIRADLERTVAMVNTLELQRAQLIAFRTATAADTAAKPLREEAEALDKRLSELEAVLFNTRITGRGQDLIRWPARIAEQLVYLGQQVTSNDIAPTEPQQQVAKVLGNEVNDARTKYDALQREVAAFRRKVMERGGNVIF
ncbi:MAG: VPS10 domain-containing protein [Gemmatimonadota bacterium]|jgi:photosystem II stability/assembly factor-like uncharacterized protein